MALQLEPLIAGKAKERQRGGQGGILLSQKSDEANEVSTKKEKERRKEISEISGVSEGTIAKVKTIEQKAAPHNTKKR